MGGLGLFALGETPPDPLKGGMAPAWASGVLPDPNDVVLGLGGGMLPKLSPDPMAAIATLLDLPFNPPAPLLVRARAASGTTLNFRIFRIGDEVPEQPGVYIAIHRGQRKQSWLADYIGKTRDFRRRLKIDWLQHHRWLDILLEGSTHFAVFPVFDAQLRTVIERDFIRAYRPPCNKQGVPSF